MNQRYAAIIREHPVKGTGGMAQHLVIDEDGQLVGALARANTHHSEETAIAYADGWIDAQPDDERYTLFGLLRFFGEDEP